MFRTALVQSLRCASRVSIRAYSPISRSITPMTYVAAVRTLPSFNAPRARLYSASAGLGKDEVEGRIMDILKNFDKVQDTSKLTNTSHFSNDLGLDSLDTVEVVMAIEEEFSIEIPDKEADAIHSIDKAVEYILSQPDAH